MAIDHILINGCSHSAGSEIEGSAIGESHYNRKNCFGAQVAKKLNASYTNLAGPGSGNDYICRSTLFWCLQNKEKIKNTLFLIHWTSPWRMDYFVNKHIEEDDLFWQDEIYDKNVGHINPQHSWPNFYKEDRKIIKKVQHFFLNDTHWQIQKYLNIIYLQTILKGFNAKYIFKNAHIALPRAGRYKSYYEQIDSKYFIGLFDENNSFFEHCLNAGYDIDGQMYWHHKLPAHTYWANKLYKEFTIQFPS